MDAYENSINTTNRGTYLKRNETGNLFMLIFLVFYLLVQFVIGVVYILYPDNPVYESPWFIILTQFVCFYLPVLLILAIKHRKATPIKFNRPRMIGVANIALIFLISLFIQPLLMLVSGAMALVFPNPVNELLQGYQSSSLPIMLVMIAIMPAVCEETVFRGLILAQYSEKNKMKAAIITALYFGMVHFSAQQFLYAFAIGIMLAYFVFHTHSLLASMLSHFFINATQLLLHHFVAQYGQSLPDEPIVQGDDSQMLALYSLLILSLFVLPVLIVLYRVFVKHNKKRKAKHEQKTPLGTAPEYPGMQMSTESPVWANITASIDILTQSDLSAQSYLPGQAYQPVQAYQPGQTGMPEQAYLPGQGFTPIKQGANAGGSGKDRFVGPWFWAIVAVYALMMFVIEVLPRIRMD